MLELIHTRLRMDKVGVTAVCLLLIYFPSVLNLPLVPKPAQQLEQDPTEHVSPARPVKVNRADSLNAHFVQYVKPKVISGHTSNTNGAQLFSSLPHESKSKNDVSSDSPKRNLQESSSSKPSEHNFNNKPSKSLSILKFGASQNNSSVANQDSNLVLAGSDHAEFTISNDSPSNLQLAVSSDLGHKGEGHTEASEMMLTVGTGLAALFSLGLVIGLFSCCCPKKPQSTDIEMTKNEKTVANERPLEQSQKPSQVFNASDLPTGNTDLDEDEEPKSFKDRLKAIDTKLAIQPSPDKRKSQNMEQIRQPKITVSEEETKGEHSKSTGDNVSKSDTQDDISDKIFDNISTHSSVSQPYNPDVVVADTDDEEDFAEIQRGTTILKSFQRAKPPRNRSPATRTSKGKIRKSRPNVNSPSRTPGSTPSSTSAPVTPATPDSKTNSCDKSESKMTKKDNSLDKNVRKLENKENGSRTNSLDKKAEKTAESAMTKSSDFSDFDSIMSQSVTSIGSDIVTPMKRNGKYAKNKGSPMHERRESPARVLKTKEREVTEKEKESRTESPSRYRKKSGESPVSKRKNRRREPERGANRLSSDISENKEVTESSPANRLSGVATNANNNIFYLIDPTVKSKCKSVGDVAASNRKSADFSKDAQKAVKHKAQDNQSPAEQQCDDKLPPIKRERTFSDPSRNPIEQTKL